MVHSIQWQKYIQGHFRKLESCVLSPNAGSFYMKTEPFKTMQLKEVGA